MSRGAGHILMCGYTPSTEAALAELAEERATAGVTILSRKQVPDMDGVKHYRLDYLNVNHLRDRRVGLDTCSVCVVFAESAAAGDHPRTIDMHTVLAVYNIRKERPDVPVIAEVLDRENTAFIEELRCNDVIYKETIDSNLITSCVLHPNISPIFYDLITVRGKMLKSTTIEELGMGESHTTYRDVRLKGLEQDVTYLGYITPSGAVELMPANDTVILPVYTLVYIQ
mgnify:CR=1 FL=1